MIGRSEGEKHDTPPDLTLASMDTSVPDATRQGLTLGPLFLFIARLAEAEGLSPGDAAKQLVDLSGQPGTASTLVVEGHSVAARRHDILTTGDWAITTLDSDVAVCVAGRRGVTVPALERVDMTLWEGPITSIGQEHQ
jgi:hypothetical protein